MGKYEVVAHIATGGMGAVYRATDTENNRDVALKVLPPEMAAKPAMLERFRREARHAAKLRHENIVTVFEFDEYNGTYFIAMEFVDGVDLYEYVKNEGPLDPEEARQLILQGCRALRHAFDQDIVHRDIKPSNFLITRKNGRPLIKLTDMGLARETNNDEFRVTRAGTTVGTLDYMAPEQARDSSAADIRSDLYALGSTWYHLVAGKAPFPEGGLAERLYKIMNDEPPDIRDINPRVSDQTWAILSKLLAKDPDDRYQTPAELIDDLLGLEGKAVARKRPAPANEDSATRRAKGKKKGKRRSDDTEADTPAPRTTAAGKSRHRLGLWLIVAASLLLLVSGVTLAVLLSTRDRKKSPAAEEPLAQPNPPLPGSPPPVLPPPITRPPDPDKENTNQGKEKGKEDEKAKPPAVERVRLPVLYTPSQKLDLAGLRQQVEKPWQRTAAAGESFVARVRRAPGEAGAFPSLAAACAAAPAGKAIVLEVHDNGPLFETPVALVGRNVVVRPGPGYRPLLVWDVARSLEERKNAKREEGPEKDGPLTFVSVQKGNLALEGLDLACRWPEEAGDLATLFAVHEGNLSATDCTFSVAGKHREGLTLFRVEGGPPGASRCRLLRCHARGGVLTALDLASPGLEALLDGCLLSGGEQPLVKVRTDSRNGLNLKVVRSTLVCKGPLLDVKPMGPTDKTPALRCLLWDALCSRTGQAKGGEMVALRDGADPQEMTWEAHNALYAGWQTLLSGPRTIGGDEVSAWQRQWKRIEGDGSIPDPWPDRAFNEPATVPAATFAPNATLAFASTVNPEAPLGCDLKALPPGRDSWLALAYDPALTLPDPPSGSGPPAIPAPGDELYHGETLDLQSIDLGAHLVQVQKRRKLGPKVVLHLEGKGERPTSPIRLTGTSLTLYFVPPAKDETPLSLRMSGAGGVSDPAALVELKDGDLEVINGHLKVADLPGPRVPWVVKVQGGNVRLFRTRIEGPQQSVPELHRGLIYLGGSGDPSPEKVWNLAASESVLVSGRNGLEVHGIGARVLLRQTLLVAGSQGLRLDLKGCKGRANVQCLLENVTVAAQQAALGLADAPEAGVPVEPALLLTRHCAYLNPFLDRLASRPAGLLVYEGEALARGLLTYQGERDSYDRRLFFAAAPANKVPEKSEGHGRWSSLWGSGGVQEVRPEPTPLRSFDTRRWPLERLTLPADRGANLDLLGVIPKKTRPGG